VLEAALGILECNKTGAVYNMTTSVERPEPFKPGFTENVELSLK
jgi:hypothetical protein